MSQTRRPRTLTKRPPNDYVPPFPHGSSASSMSSMSSEPRPRRSSWSGDDPIPAARLPKRKSSLPESRRSQQRCQEHRVLRAIQRKFSWKDFVGWDMRTTRDAKSAAHKRIENDYVLVTQDEVAHIGRGQDEGFDERDAETTFSIKKVLFDHKSTSDAKSARKPKPSDLPSDCERSTTALQNMNRRLRERELLSRMIGSSSLVQQSRRR